jgi:hypothetical protein
LRIKEQETRLILHKHDDDDDDDDDDDEVEKLLGVICPLCPLPKLRPCVTRPSLWQHSITWCEAKTGKVPKLCRTLSTFPWNVQPNGWIRTYSNFATFIITEITNEKRAESFQMKLTHK